MMSTDARSWGLFEQKNFPHFLTLDLGSIMHCESVTGQNYRLNQLVERILHGQFHYYFLLEVFDCNFFPEVLLVLRNRMILVDAI